MDYRAGGGDDGNYGGEKKKKSWMFRIFKWIVYSVSMLVIVISIYRCASTGMPAELKNYIAGNQKIEQAYAELKDDFVMYSLDIRNPFALGDAFFAENVYYLESAGNLQLTLRCKTSRLPYLFRSSEQAVLARPFDAYLQISQTSESEDPGCFVFEPASEIKFGKNDDSYVYFVYSFDDVAIDYNKSKLEFYVFDSISGAFFDEDAYLARFTLFDVNMPKKKMQLKKFTIH